MINIAKALIAAQKEMGNATKDSKNPFFKSKYADLNSIREACLPPLNANGIAVLQPICNAEGKHFVKTILLHESGETIESLTEILFNKANDPQAQGSGITYARRYGLQSLVCIGAEDDDGNKAAATPKDQSIDLDTISDEQVKKLEDLLELAKKDKVDFCKSQKVNSLKEIKQAKFDKYISRLNEIINENTASQNN